jgi:hypothetical protein
MGGLRLIDKVCTRCNIVYKGNPNQQLCNDCKIAGYEHKCLRCNTIFLSEYRYTKHCTECQKNRAWLTPEVYNSKSRLDKISKAKKEFAGSKEGKKFYSELGKSNSIKMKAFNQTEQGISNLQKSRINNSRIMREKIASGEFIPNITNSWTHWSSIVRDNDGNLKKFRSSWEACFWLSNPDLLYEYVRIPYYDSKGVKRTYIADFFCASTNTLFELKPVAHYKLQELKLNQIIDYCKLNSIQFIWINENNLLSYIIEDKFQDELNKVQLNKVLNAIC